MNPEAKQKYDSFPLKARARLMEVRLLIFDCASERELGEVTESLKWGELSYLVVGGSPIRLGWTGKTPDQFSVYFNCKTRLIDTFRALYGDCFSYKGTRELVFDIDAYIPEKALKHCMFLALRYHKLKHLSLLGA